MVRIIILHSQHDHERNELVPVPSNDLLPRQADNDAHLIELWLHGRSEHTQRAYRADVDRFLGSVSKTLHMVTLGDTQGFAVELVESDLQPASVHR